MILAAGLGTRLRPFSDQHPKALYMVDGKTLLEHAFDHVKSAGIGEVVINVHHFAQQITDYLGQNNNFGLKVSVSDETGELLETGGGLKHASRFFTGCHDLLVRNVDVLSDLDLQKMISFHRAKDVLATLAVRNRPTSRYLLFDADQQLCGWENRKTGEQRISRASSSMVPFAFSGIQVVSSEIFPMITEVGKFSLTDLYLRLSADQEIIGYPDSGTIWEDVGTYREQ